MIRNLPTEAFDDDPPADLTGASGNASGPGPGGDQVLTSRPDLAVSMRDVVAVEVDQVGPL